MARDLPGGVPVKAAEWALDGVRGTLGAGHLPNAVMAEDMAADARSEALGPEGLETANASLAGGGRGGRGDRGRVGAHVP